MCPPCWLENSCSEKSAAGAPSRSVWGLMGSPGFPSTSQRGVPCEDTQVLGLQQGADMCGQEAVFGLQHCRTGFYFLELGMDQGFSLAKDALYRWTTAQAWHGRGIIACVQTWRSPGWLHYKVECGEIIADLSGNTGWGQILLHLDW